MNPVRLVLIVFALACVSLAGNVQAEFDAQKQSEPPHARPADSGRELTYTLDPDFLVELARWNEEAAEAERIANEEAQRVARDAADAASRMVPSRSPTGAGTSSCGPSPLPAHIIERESGGDCDAFNASGCGGRGCAGYAQIDQGHFAEVSPWNPSVSGTCYGLSYDECVDKLWAGGAGASHWR